MFSSRIAASLILLCVLGLSHVGAWTQPQFVVVESQVTTGSGSTGVLARPSGQGPFPAVLHLHGSGDTARDNIEVLRIFARSGYVAMDIDYRRRPPGSIDLQDIHRSLEFLNASKYVRRDAIALNGYSLGGRTALLIAAQSRVRAVSAIAARTSSGSNPTVLQQSARLTVPVLLQHGTQDAVVPYADAVALEKKLRNLGRPVELISYPSAGHGDLPWRDVYGRVLEFFDTKVRW